MKSPRVSGNSMAIRAVQICVFTALALGPPQKKRFDFEVLLRPSQQSIRTAGQVELFFYFVSCPSCHPVCSLIPLSCRLASVFACASTIHGGSLSAPGTHL